jgi:hypothetical protein
MNGGKRDLPTRDLPTRGLPKRGKGRLVGHELRSKYQASERAAD